ncbi:hypothetical protein [Alkalibacillus haloalkaliphilus]|uniref:hypothetical protein n=1 Tax=Alkalibacillus haloalkaliphilus TaxID=94136 RepID=UPI00293699F8|nr:hypothetical protein [Alkalibacillus haloalkaliphilus]MDV2581451.1 hypothetical protein [Alkalibacillus haloalkaliphilus]
MNDFDQFLKDKEPNHEYSIEDVEYIQCVNNEIDYIQYHQVKDFYESVDTFQEINNIVYKRREIKGLMDTAIQTYLKEHCMNKEKLRKTLDNITHVEGLDELSKEEYINAVQKDFVKRQQLSNQSLMKELRYPELM